MSRILAFLFATLCLCLSVSAQVSPEAQTLIPGQSVEREIAGGESHTYQISLAAGQFIRVVVEQRGMDVKLSVAGADGKPLIESDLTGIIGVPDSLTYETPAAGTYQLVVRANGAATRSGAYAARLEVKASTGDQDRRRITAESLLNEARKLYSNGGSADPRLSEKLGQALGIFGELEDRYLQGLTLNLMGLTHSGNGQYEKAIEAYEQALTLWRGEKLRAGEAQLLNNVGTANVYLNRYDKGIEYFGQAVTILHELKDRFGEASALDNQGIANGGQGFYEEAIGFFEQALAIYREVKDRGLEARMLRKIAQNYGYLGRHDKKIELGGQALEISRAEKDLFGEQAALDLLGLAYVDTYRYEKAIEMRERWLAIARELKNFSLESMSLVNLGVVYHKMGQTEKAIEYYEQALALAREKKLRSSESSPLINLSAVEIERGNLEKAIEYLEQSLAVARETKNLPSESTTLLNLALCYKRMGRIDKAVEYLKMNLAIWRERGQLAAIGLALNYLAQFERERDPAAARAYVEESLKIWEDLRRNLMSPQSRAQHAANVVNSYKLYAEVLMRQHKAEPTKGFDAAAFESSEFQRARSLLDLLAEAGADIRQGVDAALLERERSIGEQLSEKAGMLTRAKPDEAETLKKEVGQLETDLERAQAAIRKASPNYAALTQPQPVKLSEIQAQLDADTVLFEYSLGAQGQEQSYLWAVTRYSLATYELPKVEIIEKSAREVYELLTARSTNKSGETAEQRQERVSEAEAKLPAAALELSKTILAPVAAQLGKKRLVIVADGALQYIPFAMLPDPAAYSNQPLIVTHEVVSLPSASTLVFQRSELAGRQPAPKLLAVIADPVFDRSDERFKTAATDAGAGKPTARKLTADDKRSIEHLAENSGDKSGVTTLRMVIPRLPFTRQEATHVLALAPKNSSLAEIDFQASRENVLKGDLSQYRYVHFATHGLLDTERPGLSSLVLSMVDEKGQPLNGFLRANDIYNLKLPAELVVLSACQTGLGKDIKGEGLVGLTRGFMYAGAARVVVSLWSVNDKATADLMTKFYEKMLKQGQPPAAALRAAQVEMWKQKQWQSPYYWAAFTMQGEWR